MKSVMSYKKMFSRNIGFLSEKEQGLLSQLSVGIAGAGGDGGLLAERLVRFGIGEIILADPEVFELNNINRQFGATPKTVGKNKARVIARELLKINPEIQIRIYTKGINLKNVEEFVASSDVIIDEVEFTVPSISVLLAREARKQKKYVFMGANVGWGASVFCFDPNGVTFEKYFQYNEKNNTINALKYVGKIPDYIPKNLVKDVLDGKKSMPSISSSVSLVASLVSSGIILFLAKKIKPITVPNKLFFDARQMTLTRR